MASVDSWDLVTIDDVSVNWDSKRVPVKKSDRHFGPYPYYGASGVVDHVDGYLFDGEYLLVAEDGENLNTRFLPIAFMAEGKFWVNNHAHILQGNGRALTRFLHYALLEIDGYITGSAQPKLTQRSLKSIKLLLPSRPEQEAIVRVLDGVDGKIAQNNKVVRLLRELGVAILDLFSGAEPDGRAVLERWAGENPLFRHLATVWDGAGWYPESVPQASMADVCRIDKQLVQPQERPDQFFAHHSIPAFDNGELPSVELGLAIRSGKYVVSDGAVLVSKLNPRIPRVWLPPVDLGYPAICSTEFLVCAPHAAGDRAFLYLHTLTRDFQDQFASRVTGTSNSHQRVKPADFLGLSLVLPPPDVRRGLDKVLRSLVVADERCTRREPATSCSTRRRPCPAALW